MARQNRKSRAKRHREEALFRHHVISRVLALEFGGAVRSEAIEGVARDAHFTSDGRCCRVSARTIYRWLAAYAEAGTLERRSTPRPVAYGRRTRWSSVGTKRSSN